MKSFWTAQAKEVAAFDIKKAHGNDRLQDKRLRWSVKKLIRDDGATSNLYPIGISPTAVVHRYALEVHRKMRVDPVRGKAGRAGGGVVAPTRAWKAFSQSLKKFPTLPAIVRLQNFVYSTKALPEELLELPKEYYDLGWESCRLTPIDHIEISKMPQPEVRLLVNKIVPWSLGQHAQRDGHFAVVRDSDSKLVCTQDGLSCSGLRIFRGTTAHALFINTGAAAGPPAAKPSAAVPTSSVLHTLPIGMTAIPVDVLCVEHVRNFDYKGRLVQIYTLEDASGRMIMTLWGSPTGAMKTGATYRLTGVKVKMLQNNTIGLEGTHGASVITMTKPPPESSGSDPQSGGASEAQSLALRIDTKCTVASERSIWEEVKQHFGPGPYDDEKQRKISRAVQGTPVVISVTLKHTLVRVVRFNFASAADAPLDHAMKAIEGQLERGQPFAVLADYSVVPLQVLHCCFDPRMRSWMDITVAACSFLPLKRLAVLNTFRAALDEGMTTWGLVLQKEPWVTRSLATLEEPKRERANMVSADSNSRPPQSQQQQQHQSFGAPNVAVPRSTQRTILFCSVSNARATAEDREGNTSTAQLMAKAFKSVHHADVNSEQDALKAIDSTLLPGGVLADKNSAVVLVTNDRQCRAIRWMYAECLRRGVMPIVVPGAKSPKRQALLVDNTKYNLFTKQETNPLKGVTVSQEVPVLKNKRVLVLGVDTCHTHDITTGAVIGVLIGPTLNHMIPTFWRNEVRGQEVEQVTEHFGYVVQKAMQYYQGLDEVIVFQDGNVFSELESMRSRVPVGVGLTFMCLHKRTNIRFLHRGKQDDHAVSNVIKGSVVQSLTPAPIGIVPAAPSFYLQNHDCNMSTARTVQYTVHSVSSTLDVADVQRLSYVLAHVHAPMATKLPISTRCAHKLSAIAERLIDANPELKSHLIPEPLCSRMWFL